LLRLSQNFNQPGNNFSIANVIVATRHSHAL
jgi:hypothetical protein